MFLIGLMTRGRTRWREGISCRRHLGGVADRWAPRTLLRLVPGVRTVCTAPAGDVRVHRTGGRANQGVVSGKRLKGHDTQQSGHTGQHFSS